MSGRHRISTERGYGGGFTLIEVLVAMAILALVSTTVLKQMSSSSQQLAQMEIRSFARLLAQNRMAEIRLGLASSDDPIREIEFANRDWYLETEIEPAAEELVGLNRIEVRSYLGERGEDPHYQLVGYAQP